MRHDKGSNHLCLEKAAAGTLSAGAFDFWRFFFEKRSTAFHLVLLIFGVSVRSSILFDIISAKARVPSQCTSLNPAEIQRTTNAASCNMTI